MIKFDKNKDKIAIIAPASGLSNADGMLDKERSFELLKKTVKFFENHGFQTIYDEKIFDGDILPYFASSKKERARQIKKFLEDPSVKIISAFRGGYGSSSIAFGSMDVIPSGEKILVGFSDITALHLLFNQHFKFRSIHGAMNLNNLNATEQLVSLISGESINIDVFSLNKVTENKIITGELIGGNLAVLCTMIGTKLHPNTEGKILLLEDINESGYKIHRYLTHMYNAGLFEKTEAVIFGDFSKSDQYLEISIQNFVAEYLSNIPAYKTDQIGHGTKNYPVIMGANYAIENEKLVATNSV